MNRYTLLPLLLVAFIAQLHAQVRVNAPIRMTGENAEQRQVKGLPSETIPGAVLSAEVELSGQHRYAEPAAGTLWTIALPALEEAPQAGTHVLVRSPQPTDGPVQIMLNEHGPYPLISGANTVIDGAWLPAGSVLSVVFDGENLRMINGATHGKRACPAGMVAVNDQYCMQADRSPSQVEFWDAIENCGSQGLRLCTWGEYVYACINAADLEITDLPNGWEWTNQTANEDMSVRIVANTSCYAAGVGTTQTPMRYYRCCYTR